MLRVAFVTFYNDFSVGVNVLSSLLSEKGHPVIVIFFKVPSISKVPWFADHTTEYMEVINNQGDILAGNAVTNRWTDREIELLVSELSAFSPGLVCFSSRTQDDRLAEEVYPLVRNALPEAVTMAGGFGPSINPEHYAKLVDYVFIGEAEGVIDDLVDKLARGEKLHGEDNIAYMNGESLIRNDLGRPDALNFRKQIKPTNIVYIDRGTRFAADREKEIAKPHCYSTFFGRGCVQKCSYCAAGHWRDIYKSAGYTLPPRRNRPVDDVIDELKTLRDQNVTFVHIRDEYMTAPRKVMLSFFERYEKEIGLPFWCYLVPQQVVDHPEILKAAVDAGFVDTEIGFQSGSDTLNAAVFTRKLKHAVTVEYCRMLSDYDINMKYDFIVFNPAESDAHVEETWRLIQSLPKKRAYLFMPRLFYYPITPINRILQGARVPPEAFGRHYARALSYLICFVTSPEEFADIMSNRELADDWQSLKSLYTRLLLDKEISFTVGTHEKPESITTPRYARIIRKHKYKDMIIWGEQGYFEQMQAIFPDTSRLFFIGDFDPNRYATLPPEAIISLPESLPVFVCTADKLEARAFFNTHHRGRPGKVYV